MQCPRTTQAGRQCQRSLTAEGIARAGAGKTCGVCGSQGSLRFSAGRTQMDALRQAADDLATPGGPEITDARIDELTGGSWDSYKARTNASRDELFAAQVGLARRHGWPDPERDTSDGRDYFEVWHEPDGDHFDSIRVTTDRELTDDEMQRMAQCLGYAMRAGVGGEGMYGPPRRVAPTTYEMYLDTTKNSREQAENAWDNARDTIWNGSPVRKTDRAGPGTKGTRLTQGIGQVGIVFHVA